MKSSISIIVPNYNHLQFLPQRLSSIFNQTFQNFEVILLDDCSTDGSWEYLRQFENHPKVSHCVRNEVNSGSPFKQWKKGLDLANYDWIWIAESDDYNDLDFLAKLLAAKSDQSTIVFSNSYFVDEYGDLISDSSLLISMSDFEIPIDLKNYEGKEFIKNYLSKRNYLFNASGVIFKKPLRFPAVIETMNFTGDWYFWIYLSANGSLCYVDEKLNNFRFHINSTRTFKGNRNELKRCQENMDCFAYCFSYLNLSEYLKIDLKYYDQFINKYFKYIYRTGRTRFRAVFPNIPLIFLFNYYGIYLRSFFK